MWQYLVKRLFLLVVTLFGISLISFVLVALSPGDPAATAAGVPMIGGGKGGRATDEVLKHTREALYLDRPLVLNFKPNSRSRVARHLAKEICEGNDYARLDAQDAIQDGIGTAGLETFIEEAARRSKEAAEVAAKLATAVTALEGVAAGSSAAPTVLEAAFKGVQALVPGRGPRIPRRATPVEAAQAWSEWGRTHMDEPFSGVIALLDSLDKLVPPDKGGPGSKGTALERAAAWAQWWQQNASRYSEEAIDRAVKAYMDASEADRPGHLAHVEKIGAAATGPLMDIYGSSSGERRRLAAFAVSFVAHKPWDLTPKQTVREEHAREFTQKHLEGDVQAYVDARINEDLKDQEKSIARWWFRSEEEYVEFSAQRQLARAFTQTQFGNWFRKLFRLDFGRSFAKKKDVLQLIKERFPRSAWLNFFSIFFTYMIAIPLGIYSATHQKSLYDRISTVTLFVLYSLPSFWVAAILILLLCGPPSGVDWFPAHGYEDMNSWKLSTAGALWDWIKHITLPVVCLTYGGIAYVSRQMRAGMLEVIRQDYIRTARAKGLAENVVVFKHAMRNSLIPIITLVAFLLPAMFGGSVIIESVFSIDGLGKLMFEAIKERDIPLVMSEVFISGFLTLMGILIADICYAIVDPRIELK